MIKPFSLLELAVRYGGRTLGPDSLVSSVSTDTRQLHNSDLFVALVGERFDAHDHLQEAIDSGVKALVIAESECQKLPENNPCCVWLVDDTTIALGNIAQFQREQFTKPIVAITGSSGKTSVKGMLFEILSCAVGEAHVFATKGNFNNHIGVPLSLLEMTASHQYAVIEMGASAIGEIAYLSLLAEPEVAVINNVMAAHVEGFGSVDNIATAKGEIYQGLKKTGCAVVNIDDRYAQQWLSAIEQENCLLFSPMAQDSRAEVYAENNVLQKNGCYSFGLVCGQARATVHLNVLGRHNVANAVAAAACAHALGIDNQSICQGLEKFSAEKGRLHVLKGEAGCHVIDDSYNANPGSMKAAIDVLCDASSNSVFVMGDMGELGDSAISEHQQIGVYAKQKNISHFLTLGKYSKYASESYGSDAKHYETIDLLIEDLRRLTQSQPVILVKGSRSSKMERVVQALTEVGGSHASLAC